MQDLDHPVFDVQKVEVPKFPKQWKLPKMSFRVLLTESGALSKAASAWQKQRTKRKLWRALGEARPAVTVLDGIGPWWIPINPIDIKLNH